MTLYSNPAKFYLVIFCHILLYRFGLLLLWDYHFKKECKNEKKSLETAEKILLSFNQIEKNMIVFTTLFLQYCFFAFFDLILLCCKYCHLRRGYTAHKAYNARSIKYKTVKMFRRGLAYRALCTCSTSVLSRRSALRAIGLFTNGYGV